MVKRLLHKRFEELHLYLDMKSFDIEDPDGKMFLYDTFLDVQKEYLFM